MKNRKFDLKSFVTITITVTFCVLTIWKVIAFKETDIKDFLTIATMIYMFYFKKKDKEEELDEITIKRLQNNSNLSEKKEEQNTTKE